MEKGWRGFGNSLRQNKKASWKNRKIGIKKLERGRGNPGKKPGPPNLNTLAKSKLEKNRKNRGAHMGEMGNCPGKPRRGGTKGPKFPK